MTITVKQVPSSSERERARKARNVRNEESATIDYRKMIILTLTYMCMMVSSLSLLSVFRVFLCLFVILPALDCHRDYTGYLIL